MTNIRPDPAFIRIVCYYGVSISFHNIFSIYIVALSRKATKKQEKVQIKSHCDCIRWYLHQCRTQNEVQIIKLWSKAYGGNLKIFKGVIKYSIPCNERNCQYTSAGHRFSGNLSYIIIQSNVVAYWGSPSGLNPPITQMIS